MLQSIGLLILRRINTTNAKIDGYQFQLNAGDFGVTFEIVATGSYEPLSRKVLLAILSEGMIFIDIGAHVGLFSVPASFAVGSKGTVIAFEPHPENFAILRTNIHNNEIKNAQLIQSAVTNFNGVSELHESAINSGDHRLVETNRISGSKVETVTTTLDTFCEQNNITKVDVIKIDVQGSEFAVLDGMQKLLDQNKKLALIIEYSPWMLRAAGAIPERLIQKLKMQGFDISVIDESTGNLLAIESNQAEICEEKGFVNLLAIRGRNLRLPVNSV